MDYAKEALRLHTEWGEKLDVDPKVEINTKNDLSLAYTPGVAAPCLEIEKDISKSYELTGRGDLVAVVTDGTAVLSLESIGPEAGMPVMGGKYVLFKELGGVNAIPLCIKSKDMDETVHTIALLSSNLGSTSLGDVTTSRCFEIEAKLKKLCDIPIFHDDQHRTAIVTAVALLSAVELTDKNMGDLHVVINGAGSIGITTARLLLSMEFDDVILYGSKGSVYKGRGGMNAGKKEVAELANKGVLKGSLAGAMRGSDIFVGVSAPGVVSETTVAGMNEKFIVLPMANPVPGIMPDKTKHAGAFVVGTDRSGFVNQINNALALPGIFRGTLDVHTSDINEETKVATACAITSLIGDEELNVDYIIPGTLSKEVGAVVVETVAQAARESDVARI